MHIKNPENKDPKTPLRLLVKVLQDVLRVTTYDSYGDLFEAFKARAAKLKITYDAGMVTDALNQLERGGATRLVKSSLPACVVSLEYLAEGEWFSKDEAAKIWNQLQSRYRSEHPIDPPTQHTVGAPRFFPRLVEVRR